jgi:hypothetical protein
MRHTRIIVLLSTVALLLGSSVLAAGNSVTRVTLNPPNPNILLNNQKVTVSFTYASNQQVLIFARPFVGANSAPNYSASGSPTLNAPGGTGTQSFTITTGNVTVDRIRIQILNTAQTQVLFEAFLPVHYEFRAP